MSSLFLKQGLVYDGVHRQPSVKDIIVKNGKITAIGESLQGEAQGDCVTIDCSGKRIYPGFVDAHSHLGLDAYASGFDASDYNECNDPVTPQLRAIDGFNPQDKALELAVQGGVTTICTGPGSANVLGGTFMAVKLSGKRVDDMAIRPEVAMKCAFGENPKRVYEKNHITSRMTTAALLRTYLAKAREYDRKLKEGASDPSKLPAFDAKLQALLPVVRGQMPLKAHAHRADDMFTVIRIAKEFGVKLTLEHCTDGSLIAEELAAEKIPCAVGPSLGHPGKLELANKSFETPGILAKAGVNVSIITDAGVVPQEYLPLCAGLAVKNGMDEFDALKAITINAAKHIGVEDRVGSIEVGKDGDFVITKADPMLSDTEILYTIIDGEIKYKKEA